MKASVIKKTFRPETGANVKKAIAPFLSKQDRNRVRREVERRKQEAEGQNYECEMAQYVGGPNGY